MQAFVTSEYSTHPGQAIKLTAFPKPTATGRDLLVKIYAFSTNPVDFKKLKNFGKHEAKVEKEFIAGYDGAGIVEEVGSEAKNFKVGDHVFFSGVLNRNGTFAEHTLVDERIVGRKPNNLNWVQAATVPLTALTAWEGLVEGLSIAVPKTEEDKKQNGQKSILVIAGAGGVGSIVLRIAKHVLGLTTFATASRPESIEFCKNCGADHVIDHSKPLLAQLTELNFSGVDYVFNTADTVQYFDQICEVLNVLGKAVFINETAGVPVDFGKAMFKRLTLVYELMFTRPLTNTQPEMQHEILNKVADLIEQGVLHHNLTKTFKFTHEDVTKALELQASGKAVGKIGVVVRE